MNGLDRLFPQNGHLPCPFILRQNGSSKQVGNGEPAFELHVRNENGARALRSFNELAIAEAYVRGDLEIEGDIVRAMWFRGLLSDDNLWIKSWRKLQPLLLGRLKLNPGWIAKHYDSKNIQLYALDRDYRAYTPGIYHTGDETLEESTAEKYRFALDSLRVGEGEHVLEVGCGWGGFTNYCSDRGLRVTGITLSRDQFGYTGQLIKDRDLNAEVLYQDFFTFRPGVRFDGISMMGVIEDLSDYPWVLRRLAELVKPGGRVYLDFAAGKVPVATSSFITKYVWPGSFRMVYMPELMAAADEARVHVVGVWDDRRNYHLWAKNGHTRWMENREQIVRESSEETWRLFKLLFAGTSGVMNDPSHEVTAYRMVLELPPKR
ncbi:MAG: class I SAM-dependent methyltransferase [Acidobacteriota bacterium]